MAKLGMTFDSNDVPELEDFSPVPPGQYTGMVVGSEIKETSSGGEMLVLEIDIQGGEYSNRKIFENLNIKNDNQQAVDIAFRKLGNLCKAVGKATIKDSEELHNKRFLMEVSVKPPAPYKDRKTGEERMSKARNEIKKYLSVTGTSSVEAATAPSSAAEAKPSDSTPPWKRSKA